MERECFDEMKINLARLSEAGVIGTSGAPVFLFAHCGATMELADELLKMEIKPVAILDNNPDKYGLNYKGIPVCEPQVAMRNTDSETVMESLTATNAMPAFRSEDAVILIVSRFYEQMASQMRSMGFAGRIEKLTDYNTYAEYSLEPDALIRKSGRLNRGIEKLKYIKSEHKDYFVVLCPFPALGDIYFCMSYLKPYLGMVGREKCLVCVVGNAQKQVAELFGYPFSLC